MEHTPDAFSRHAATYADRWESDPVATRMRAVVHDVLGKNLAPGSALLDAGCGTGVDAAHFLAAGHTVVATDLSAGMVDATRRRAPGAEVHRCSADAVHTLGRRFDGALLNFGVINCLPPHPTAASLAAALRPGAVLAVVTMPRLHPAWMLYRLAQGHPRESLRRLRRRLDIDVEGLPVPTWYRSAPELRRAFRPWFSLVEQHALGQLLPPTGPTPPQPLVSATARIEPHLRRLPLLREVGDHVLLLFRRRPAPTAQPDAGPLQRRWWTRAAQHDGHVRRLRTLILEVTRGCQSACAGCDYRGPAGGEALTVARCVSLCEEARARGAVDVLLTGGEPLLRPDFDALLSGVAQTGLAPVVLTNGLALARHAQIVGQHAASVVLSLDGHDEDSYQRARGVRGFSAVQRGVAALRAEAPHLPITARVTVSSLNARHLDKITEAAQEMGLFGVSFLAADTDSAAAFGRDPGAPVGLSAPEPGALREALAALRSRFGDFVVDSDPALSRVADKFSADAGQQTHRPPRCDAPWTSALVGADLKMRPCFFLPGVADATHGLDAGLSQLAPTLAALDVSTQPECARCVCWARLT